MYPGRLSVFGTVPQQPNFGLPGEVRDLSAIVVGATYRRVWTQRTADGEAPTTLKVLSEPSNGWVEVEQVPESGIKYRVSLADMGVIPYENGTYNAFNALVRV